MYFDPSPSGDYADQLSHPDFQKLRLLVFERDGWACRDCDAKNKRLTLHHCIYIRGRKAWEYPPELLVSLCWDCHQVRQGREEALHIAIAAHLAQVPVRRIEPAAWALLDSAGIGKAENHIPA